MKSSLTIDARSLGDSFAGDPEFALPERPRFIREVLVIPVGHNGLLFEGTRDTQVISGRSARTFIPRLLPHLDGHHTLPMLQARFSSLPPKSVRDAIVLLYGNEADRQRLRRAGLERARQFTLEQMILGTAAAYKEAAASARVEGPSAPPVSSARNLPREGVIE